MTFFLEVETDIISRRKRLVKTMQEKEKMRKCYAVVITQNVVDIMRFGSLPLFNPNILSKYNPLTNRHRHRNHNRRHGLKVKLPIHEKPQ